MKKSFCAIAALLILIFISACSPSPSAEEEVRNFYMEYVEACIEDRIVATRKYVHHEDPAQLEWETEDANCKLLRTDVLDIERLSDDLWAIHIYYENTYLPAGELAYHFVGVINGDCKVIKNIWNIPAALSQGLDLEPYQPTGDYISPEDVLEEDDQI